jgi:hypothetical protein
MRISELLAFEESHFPAILFAVEPQLADERPITDPELEQALD